MSLERLDFSRSLALFDAASSRAIEAQAAKALAPHTLMQRAGWAVARLACALAPHERVFWIACGPGNNGGDGLEAAMHLRIWGLEPIVTWLGDAAHSSPDTLASFERARDAGVTFADTPPAQWGMAIDALLGLGAARAPQGQMRQWLDAMALGNAPVLHVDLPSGLDADTGCWLRQADGQDVKNATNLIAPCAYSMPAKGELALKKYTLSLLTLKPGLFTADGRDACGEIWFDDLGVQPDAAQQAWLLGENRMRAAPRLHASHKGSYGDVAVVGGAQGMQGAALLAARAALHAGAGRVFVGLLGGGMVVDPMQPELMFREPASLDFSAQTVVCGCGGGDAVRQVLPRVLSAAAGLVLDADALNAIAQDAGLQKLLQARATKAQPTMITPHPLEAARLLGSTTAQVQADRLQAAQALAERFDCTVILKGSGSIVASPGQIPAVNPTGDARLATAGTGDVLAGICGSFLAQHIAQEASHGAFQAAQRACWTHGALASESPDANARVIPASQLIGRLLSQR